MLDPVATDDCNAVLKAPANWDEKKHGPCVPLPLRLERLEGEPGVMLFTSAWRPSIADLLRLLVGGVLRLQVIGTAHPPVALWTERRR